MKPPDRAKCRELLVQLNEQPSAKKTEMCFEYDMETVEDALRYCAELPRVVWLYDLNGDWIGCTDGTGEADVTIRLSRGGYYVDMTRVNGHAFPVHGNAEEAKVAVEKAVAL